MGGELGKQNRISESYVRPFFYELMKQMTNFRQMTFGQMFAHHINFHRRGVQVYLRLLNCTLSMRRRYFVSGV